MGSFIMQKFDKVSCAPHMLFPDLQFPSKLSLGWYSAIRLNAIKEADINEIKIIGRHLAIRSCNYAAYSRLSG